MASEPILAREVGKRTSRVLAPVMVISVMAAKHTQSLSLQIMQLQFMFSPVTKFRAEAWEIVLP